MEGGEGIFQENESTSCNQMITCGVTLQRCMRSPHHSAVRECRPTTIQQNCPMDVKMLDAWSCATLAVVIFCWVFSLARCSARRLTRRHRRWQPQCRNPLSADDTIPLGLCASATKDSGHIGSSLSHPPLAAPSLLANFALPSRELCEHCVSPRYHPML